MDRYFGEEVQCQRRINFDDLKLKMDDCKLTNDKDSEVCFEELETINLKLKGIATK